MFRNCISHYTHHVQNKSRVKLYNAMILLTNETEMARHIRRFADSELTRVIKGSRFSTRKLHSRHVFWSHRDVDNILLCFQL